MTAQAAIPRLRRIGVSGVELWRNWATHGEFVRAAIDIRKGQLEIAEWDLVPFSSEMPAPDKGLIQEIRARLESPNPGDVSFGSFISAVAEDLMVLDAGCVEKERQFNGEIAHLWPTDGAPIKVDRFWSGDPAAPRYYYVPQPNIEVPLLNTDLIYMMIHRRAQMPIGIPYLETLKGAIDAELNGSLVNARQVLQAAPDGILDMGENARPEQVTSFRSYFEQELAGQGALGFWGGTKGAKFIKFRGTNQEMQFLDWLRYEVSKIAVVFQLSPQDLAQMHDINRSQGEVQQENSDDRGQRTLLSKVQDFLTAEVCWDPFWKTGNRRIGRLNNIAFRFRGATDRQNLSRAQTKKITVAGMPVESINSARIDLGWPPIGDPNDPANPYNKLMANTPLGLVTLDDVPSARELYEMSRGGGQADGETPGKTKPALPSGASSKTPAKAPSSSSQED